MTDTLGKITDQLVTRDNLDMRLQEQRSYMDANFSAIDRRFTEQQAFMDGKFSASESRFVEERSEVDEQFAAIAADFEASGILCAQSCLRRFTSIVTNPMIGQC